MKITENEPLKMLRGLMAFLAFFLTVSFCQAHGSSEESASLLTRSSLTGDWFGARSRLADKGVEFEFVYTAEVMANVDGGLKRDTEYLDNTDLILSVDGEKLLGWKGSSFCLYGLGNWGGDPSLNSGDIQVSSNIEGPNRWALFEAWYQQKLFKDHFSFLVGLYDLNSEFDSIEAASLFFNSSHGMGIDLAQSGLAGPSTFPATSLGLRLKWEPKDSIYVQTVVLDGGAGDLNNPRSPVHVHLSKEEGALVAAEAGFSPGIGDENNPYTKLALGAWFYSSQFGDLIDTDSLGNPVRRPSFGIYAFGEHQFYQESQDPDQGLTSFIRLGYATPSVNQINYYLGAGAVYKGLIVHRDADQMGIGIATAINGEKFNNTQRVLGINPKKAEMSFETTYRAELLPWLAFQPGLQYILNPGTNGDVSHAIQVGSRLEFVL